MPDIRGRGRDIRPRHPNRTVTVMMMVNSNNVIPVTVKTVMRPQIMVQYQQMIKARQRQAAGQPESSSTEPRDM